MRSSVVQNNLSGGELSRSLQGRFDLAIFYNGVSWLQNYISSVQGKAIYRPGKRFVWTTRGNDEAILIPFEYNTEQAYILEFTANKIRIIKDGGLVTNTGQIITGVTQANPAVLTYDGADNFANGDRVVLSEIEGMVELNNQEYIVANVDVGANTFELQNASGQNVDSTNYTAYSSGGMVAEIVEVATSYGSAQLFELDYAQTNDTLYIVHKDHEPAKLTRSSHTSWTLADVTFVSNPFGTTKASSQAITGATAANPVVVTYSGADTYANGDTVYIDAVVGMTQLNGKNYTVANVNSGANTFELQGTNGTSYTTYSSGGTIEEYTAFSYPSKVTFFEQRLVYGASDSYPQSIWGSVGGSYDKFLTGTAADDSFKYTIAAGQANRIRWMAATEDFLAIGTAGAEFKAEGGNDDPITPTNISIKPPSYYGSADVRPIRLDSHILYLTRDKLTARTFEFDAIQDGFTSINRNLTADEILQGRYGKSSGVKQVAFQSGSPSINWMVRNDGILVGLTFEPREQVNGWHRHIAGGAYDGGKLGKPEYESVAKIPQATGPDQVYVVVKRTISGQTVRYIEYFVDQPAIPNRNDYFTDVDSEDDDTEVYLQDLWEAQKRINHLDASIIFDGTVSETLVLSALTGDAVTVTAGGAVFDNTMVGREVWAAGGGRGVITEYTSSTVVEIDVYDDFRELSHASGTWYLTNNEFGGAQHLRNETIKVLGDGAVINDVSVSQNGIIELDRQVSYAIAGLAYTGLVIGMDVEAPGETGSGSTHKKSVSQLGLRFLHTAYCRVGTSLYKTRPINFRDMEDAGDRPAPLFSGVVVDTIKDSWENEKRLYFVNDEPLPCTLQIAAPRITVNDG